MTHTITKKINPLALLEMYECGEDVGVCTECGEIAQNVEPDATNYVCEACGARAVQGVETLLMSAMQGEIDETL